jgi:protein-L-isoaspartate(D-aspartate) O-methyltransferase
MKDLSHQRTRMVEMQIARRGIRNESVLDAMRRVPREKFVSEGMAEFAYDDTPLPIEDGQTISQPYIVAYMIDAADVHPGDKVLEIGTGSGYAAAVLAQIAAEVYTIERHPRLAEVAARRFQELGYNNIKVRVGDGTLGWPEVAPFDAILAAAGGPDIPDTLKRQLAIGGRLVMPVGPQPRQQKLIKLTRTGEDSFTTENLGDVLFVPLIGAHGWAEDADRRPTPSASEPSVEPPARAQPARPLQDMIFDAAEGLPDFDDPAFGARFDRFASARVVLLGEASHGTSEFYRARAAITRRLIEKHGFTIVAVEADWPDAAVINAYVRHRPLPANAEPPFQRFPTWMWRNTDVNAFLLWLREHNGPVAQDKQAGFYGLDLYNLNGSIRAVIDYLDRHDPEAAAVARERYGCLSPWKNEPQAYGRMALTKGYAVCEQPVVAMLQELLGKARQYAAADPDEFLDAAQNARLIRNAEAYYRAMYYGAAESWNLRDTHMFETLQNLLAAKGTDAKAVVWAHNSHIGNAAFTEMGALREELNVGQLCREHYGEEAALIGFGTHTGTVAAASDWDGPMEIKQVRPSRNDSYERLAHDSGRSRFLLDLREGHNESLRLALMEPRLERFIGVIYRPESERWSHYSEAALPLQFDAYVWFDETRAVTPLPTTPKEGPPETYPFGV